MRFLTCFYNGRDVFQVRENASLLESLNALPNPAKLQILVEQADHHHDAIYNALVKSKEIPDDRDMVAFLDVVTDADEDFCIVQV